MSSIRPALLLLAFAVVTLPLMPLQQIFVWTWPKMARQLPMRYHRLVCRILGVRITIIGDPPLKGPVLIASNHVSWLDIMVLSAVAPLSFIAKREVNGWPFFGSLAWLQRTVFVHRDKRHATGNSRDEMRQRFARGDILVLFPEGTSSDGNRVLPFKSAFFGAAEHDGVTVQPVSLAYCGHCNLPMPRRLRPLYAWYGGMDLAPHLWEALQAGPIEVTVVCHPTLSLNSGMNRKALANHAEHQVRRGLVQALHDPRRIG